MKENQIEVTGKIISGGETEIQNRRGNIQISTIVVEFLTKEGNKIIAYEDIGHYEFQNFYLNQEVNLIYSKTNPQNISLLMSNKNITKFKNSKEKDILPEDMIYLMSVDKKNILTELNKISYGWEYNNKEALWVNNRRNIGISISSIMVVYIAQNFDTIDYFIEKDGFKRIGQAKYDTNKIYEKDNYKATITMLKRENGQEPFAMTTITKK